MNVLGIETSCDETSIAIISDSQLKANLIASQDFHRNFGGVIPELSSRAHLQIILPLLKEALSQADISLNEIDVIAPTAGPGLIGAVLVGLNFAKGLAYSLERDFIPVNHIDGHIFSGFLMEEKPEFPYLCVVVSGGHTLLLIVESDERIIKLGSTIDDAVGEAFDKTAKMLRLEYPGGPKIQTSAESGNEDAIDFPVARTKNEFDFSFSGLKTAVLRYIQSNFKGGKIPERDVADITASFQKAVVLALTRKAEKALAKYEVKSISLVGGVAANQRIRKAFEDLSSKYNKNLVIPALEFCGDNGAMIGYRGMKLHEIGRRFSLDYNAYARIPEGWFQNK